MNNDYNNEDNNTYTPRHASSSDNPPLDITNNNINDNTSSLDTIDDIINNSNTSLDIEDNTIYTNNSNNTEELLFTTSDLRKIKETKVTSSIEPPSNNNLEHKKHNRKRKKNKLLWTILLIFFIIVIIFSLLKIFLWGKDNKNTSNIVDSLNNNTEVKEKKDDENTELVNEDKDKSSDYWYYITFPLIDVDITKLKAKNSDTVGWINVNNTNINYPFVHYKDNDYYLDHSYDKKYNEAGWVFMDYRNNSVMSDKNTILYAHSRLDKTMFGSLSKTLKSSWFTNKDNHIIRLSTETENTLWQIFSVYKIKEESYYITTNFSSDEEYNKFLNTLSSRSIYNFNTKLDTSDKILTLSTCYSDTERTVVHAKLIKRSSK